MAITRPLDLSVSNQGAFNMSRVSGRSALIGRDVAERVCDQCSPSWAPSTIARGLMWKPNASIRGFTCTYTVVKTTCSATIAAEH